METFPSKIFETAELSKFIAAMLSYTLINSHTQVNDPGPKGILVILNLNRFFWVPQTMFRLIPDKIIQFHQLPLTLTVLLTW